MDVRWISCSGELLPRSDSDALAFLLPLPKTLKDSRRNVQELLAAIKGQGQQLTQSKDLQYILAKVQADGQAEAESLSTPSIENQKHHSSAEALCIDITRSARILCLLPLLPAKNTEQSSCQINTLATPSARILSFCVDSSLPSEIRTNEPLPPVVAVLKGLDSGDGETPLDSGILWGQASLVSADGRLAMARVVPDILSGSVVAPLLRDNCNWFLEFDTLVIRQPGSFKIYISLMQTSHRDGGGNGESIIEAPRELLSTVTSLIHVHAFARPSRRSGWDDLSISKLPADAYLVSSSRR